MHWVNIPEAEEISHFFLACIVANVLDLSRGIWLATEALIL